MFLKVLGILLFLVSMSSFAQSKDQVEVTVKGRHYTAKARFDHPLTTYERCTDWSAAGINAEVRALEAAIDACERDFNLDCIHVTTIYKTVLSREFIGYKACEANVRVRGYQVVGGN